MYCRFESLQYEMLFSTVDLCYYINEFCHSSLLYMFLDFEIIDYSISLPGEFSGDRLVLIKAILLQIIHYQNHAYRILSPSFHYDSRGTYLNFAYFHVEQRSRVLSIDTLYGNSYYIRVWSI